jgi:hypothetical protein
MAGVSYKLLLLSAATLTALGAKASQAEEMHEMRRVQPTERSARALSEANITDVFNSRWAATETDFVLGPDGVVTSSTKPEQKKETSNPIGNIASGYAPLLDGDQITDIDARQTGSINQIGITQLRASDTESVRDCGPPPLSQTEIKQLVVEAARRHKIDEVFATAIAWAESGFDQSRNSDKGARGPMQLMPGTAERFGVRDVCDPAENIEGGMKYLRVLLDEFQNPLLVAAAYNAGEQRIYEYGGIPPFKETVGYVAKVVNYQLGLPMPAAKRQSRGTEAVADAGDERDVGVIAVKKTGKFVGGVMHF